MNIEKVKISKVKPNPENPRVIKDGKFKKLVESIKEFPKMLEIRPIVVDENMIILGGNMRYRACKEAKLKEVHIVKADTLTPEQKQEFIIKDNVGFGEWDWDVLANEWPVDKLDEWGLELPVDLSAKEPDEDLADDGLEIPDEIQTDIVMGDLVEIGPHRILCGDSTNPDDVKKLMNGELADVGHNDPPYGMGKENEGVLNDNQNSQDLLKFNKEWIPLQFSHLKENGSFYCWGIDEPLMEIYHEILKPYISQNKATWRNLITWDKVNGMGQLSDVHRQYATADEKCIFIMMGKQDMVQNKDQFPEEWRPLLEYFRSEKKKMGWTTKQIIEITGNYTCSHYFTESQFHVPTHENYRKMNEASGGKAFTKPFDDLKQEGNSILEQFYKNRAYFNNTHDNMNSVWHYTRVASVEREATGGHATPKPLDLCSRVVKSSCPPKGLVVDFFLGSGSTMVSAHHHNRRCYGMELEPKYVQVSIDRMLKYDPKLEIKVNGVSINTPK